MKGETEEIFLKFLRGVGGNGVAKVKKAEIKQDLIDQLDRNGVYGSHYLDLIDDYMALWTIKNKLIADIRKRGVTVEYQNGANQWGHKRNDSVPELNRVSAQMLKILSELGLKATAFEAVADDDDEM